MRASIIIALIGMLVCSADNQAASETAIVPEMELPKFVSKWHSEDRGKCEGMFSRSTGDTGELTFASAIQQSKIYDKMHLRLQSHTPVRQADDRFTISSRTYWKAEDGQALKVVEEVFVAKVVVQQLRIVDYKASDITDRVLQETISRRDEFIKKSKDPSLPKRRRLLFEAQVAAATWELGEYGLLWKQLKELITAISAADDALEAKTIATGLIRKAMAEAPPPDDVRGIFEQFLKSMETQSTN